MKRTITIILALACIMMLVVDIVGVARQKDEVLPNQYEDIMQESVTESVINSTSSDTEEDFQTNEDSGDTEEKADDEIEEMDVTMHTISWVNVRALPTTSSEKLGKLDNNDEVKVTGKDITTGWYRIDFEGKEGYVRYDYLTDSVE